MYGLESIWNRGSVRLAVRSWPERKLRVEFSANPPQYAQRDDISTVDQYFGGNQEKFLDFMDNTIQAMREPTKAKV